MDIIQGLIQPPKVQSADETIPTLCDRVENSTLLSDRRSAVLALKSFSRQYRETVIASGLKPLLNTMSRDNIDDDLVKAVLETLLILFIRGDGDDDLTRNWISLHSRARNGKYPSPLVMKQEEEQVDQFSLWIADALTQSEDLLKLIIELLESENFHIKLYTIQLLEAVLVARPSRARNAMINSPTCISTLVALLDDIHEPIRDESILLLMAVVNDSPHIQKLVAFENIFERLFNIIQEEGGLRGSLVVNDCLSLINNILKYNISNQTLFLETGNLPKLALLLNEPISEKEEFFWNDQRINNVKTVLDIVSLTVEAGTTVVKQHQAALLDSHILLVVLRIAFFHTIPKKVRATALMVAADMIKDNEYAQTEFGNIDVPYFDPSLASDTQFDNSHLVPVVELLINWALYANSIHTFDTRVAASNLLKAYLSNNLGLQKQFLERQISAFKEIEKGSKVDGLKANLLEAILIYDADLKLNPYKLYFSTDILMYLFEHDNEGNAELRELLRSIKLGTAIEDEEPLTSIQTITEIVITFLSCEDKRVPIFYLSFLAYWLFADFSAVNDFLSAKENIHSLLDFSHQIEDEDVTVKCLITILLGIAFEFSSKSSPIPRLEYFDIVSNSIGRDNYTSRVKQFKEKSLFSKSQIEIDMFNPPLDDTGLPKIYFNEYFTILFKENFYRILRCFYHDPTDEPIAIVSFEAFEEVQNQCTSLKSHLSELEIQSSEKRSQLEKQIKSLTSNFEASEQLKKELEDKLSTISEKQQTLESEYEEKKKELAEITANNTSLEQLNTQKEKLTEELKKQLADTKEKLTQMEKQVKELSEHKEKNEQGINKMNRDLFSLQREKQKLEEDNKQSKKDLEKTKNDFTKQETKLKDQIKAKEILIKETTEKLNEATTQSKEYHDKIQNITSEMNEWQAKYKSHDTFVAKLTEKLKALATSFKELQAERDTIKSELEKITQERDTNIAAITSEKKSLEELYKNMESEKDGLLKKITELETGIESDNKKFEDEKSALESETKRLTLEIAEFKSNAEKLDTERERLQTLTESYKEKLNEANSSIDEKNKDLNNIQQQIEGSQSEISTLKAEITQLKTSLNEEKSTRKALEKLKEENETYIQSAQDELLQLQKEVDLLKSENKDALDNNSSLKQKYDELVKELELKNLESKQLSDNSLNLNSKIEQLEGDIKSKYNTIKELEEKLSTSLQEREENIANIADIELKLNSKEEQYTEQTNKLEELRISFEKKQSECKELESKLKSSNDDLQEKNRLTKELQKNLDSLMKDKEKTEGSLQSLLEDKKQEEKNIKKR